MPKDLDRVAIHYHDSRNPGRIVMHITHKDRPAATERIDMSINDAVALADRLLVAVRSEGYDLAAKKRKA
jgi:hypothetical protein